MFATIDFKLADIGEGIAECEVIKWFVKPGDAIRQFDRVCEVQSDKATVEITSRYDGVVRELRYKAGDMAAVGKPLLSIEVSSGDDSSSAGASAASAASAGGAATTTPSTTPSSAPNDDASQTGERALASPAVRRIAREHSIDINNIVGSGPGKRVLKDDVLRALSSRKETAAAAVVTPPTSATPVTPVPPTPAPAAAAAPSTATPAVEGPKISIANREDKVVPISGLQRIMVQTMTAANSVPTFVYGDEIVVDQLIALRKQCKPLADSKGLKLSYMPFILKATSLALEQYPAVNAHVNSNCTQVTIKGRHNIGFAMDTPRGLLVPNVKDVQEKTILDIARDMERIQALGLQGKLGAEDLNGGTISLSNIGTIGGTYCVPVLFVPQVAIAALGKFQTIPKFDSQMNVRPSTIMNISWSADHRVLDGATVARFSNAVKLFLEQPFNILMHTR